MCQEAIPAFAACLAVKLSGSLGTPIGGSPGCEPRHGCGSVECRSNKAETPAREAIPVISRGNKSRI